ncbi:hypothetical protein VTN77DRAFT_6011 [Rasamsonia byssochlamydoides]|uniref:uncharacterized protein n=1 Tax=Rasamsonia byssochlamydoides TaxID=89139 RepID=UPI0037424B1D
MNAAVLLFCGECILMTRALSVEVLQTCPGALQRKPANDSLLLGSFQDYPGEVLASGLLATISAKILIFVCAVRFGPWSLHETRVGAMNACTTHFVMPEARSPELLPCSVHRTPESGEFSKRRLHKRLHRNMHRTTDTGCYQYSGFHVYCGI